MGTRLDGKVVWITGGSRGIGAAAALACAAEGARVAISARKPGPLEETAAAIEAAGGAALAVPCHMGDSAAIDAALDAIEARLGPVDALINNAATNPYFGPLLDTPEGAWDKTFEVNLKGAFVASRQVVRRLIARDAPGSIVNVASVQGLRAAPLQGVYGMTKAALIAMSRTLAVELGPRNIRVNAVAPGLVDTKFASILTATPELAKHFTERAALKRYAAPEEIAGLLVYLVSDEASFVTGQVHVIDGGFTTT